MSSKDDLDMSDKAEHHEEGLTGGDSESVQIPMHHKALTRSVLLKTDLR